MRSKPSRPRSCCLHWIGIGKTGFCNCDHRCEDHMVPVRAEAFRRLKATNTKERQASKAKGRAALGISRGRAAARLAGESERDRKAAILEALDLYRASLRVWKVQGGLFRSLDGKRQVYVGTPGAADISGLSIPKGRRVEIEVKTPRGRSSPAQVAFAAMIREAGGVYVLARTPQEALDALKREGVIR